MLIRGHEAFFPPDRNYTIRRYIDFAKYVSLLETRQLYLARADQFEDTHEGTCSDAGVRLLARDASAETRASMVAQLRALADLNRKQMFLSCWCANEHESAAMWKLYPRSNEGVAIRTDYGTLADIIDKSPLVAGISMVQYVDYDKTVILFQNVSFPFFHKRPNFAHENELRVVLRRPDGTNKPVVPKDSTSVSLDVPVERLVQSVIVAPTAPEWFGELVETVTRRYGLQFPVIPSTLYDRPSF